MSAFEKWLLQNDSEDVAAQSGVGAWAGAAAGKGSWDAYRDSQFMKGKKATKSYHDFLGKLKEGDILFHRKPTDFAAKADLGPFEFPLKETTVMLGGKGDAFYHPSIYTGDGNIIHSEDWEKGVSRRKLADSAAPEEYIAMRPKDRALVKKAMARSSALDGTPYKSELGTIKHGLGHLAGQTIPTGMPNCGKDGLLCTEFVSESYPDIFKDRQASPRDMRHSPDLDFAARYAPRTKGINFGDKMMQYGVYPAAKMAKYGLLAAGLGYGGSELAKYLEKQKGESK